MYFYPRSPCGERPGPKSITPDRYYFYPRSPCGERHGFEGGQQFIGDISIHALLAESDHAPNRRPCHCNNFYPRSPCGERRNQSIISQANRNFYPRSPCGERREPTAFRTPHQRFLSTLSLRRATVSCNYFPFDMAISIHALLAESDFRCRGV